MIGGCNEFFKDFKEDFAQAMNELMPDSNEMYDEDEQIEEESLEKKVIPMAELVARKRIPHRKRKLLQKRTDI